MMLEICDHIVEDGKVVAITEEKKKRRFWTSTGTWQGTLSGFWALPIGPWRQCLRNAPARTWKAELTFVGLMGMIDPPRPEVKEAVKIAQGAGLKSVMVTGDYKDTAEAMAKEIGLLTPRVKCSPERNWIR